MDGEIGETVRSRIEGFAWSQAVGVGGGAFLVGYLLTVAVVLLGPSEASGNLWPVLASIAFVFYSAQNVPVLIPDLGYVNWLRYVGRPGPPEPSIPLVVFYLIPFAVLLGAGALATTRYGDGDGTPVDALFVGGGIAAGYWVLTVVGTFVFRTASSFGAESRLYLPDAAVFGLVYPFVASLLAASVVQFVRYLRANASGQA